MKTCHLNKKGIIFRLLNLDPGSAYSSLVYHIKNGTGKHITDYYVNFCLTPQHSFLLFVLRALRKSKKKGRFKKNADGYISYASMKETKKPDVPPSTSKMVPPFITKRSQTRNFRIHSILITVNVYVVQDYSSNNENYFK